MKNNVRRMLPAFALLVSLASPFAAMAQVDDVYFVPSKNSEEKVLVIKSTAEKYNISTASASQGRDVDEYNRRGKVVPRNSSSVSEEEGEPSLVYADEVYDKTLYATDYDYSRRIVRFYNPTIVVGAKCLAVKQRRYCLRHWRWKYFTISHCCTMMLWTKPMYAAAELLYM